MADSELHWWMILLIVLGIVLIILAIIIIIVWIVVVWSVRSCTPSARYPAKAFARDYVITGVGLSVCLSVCLFVCYHDN